MLRLKMRIDAINYKCRASKLRAKMRIMRETYVERGNLNPFTVLGKKSKLKKKIYRKTGNTQSKNILNQSINQSIKEEDTVSAREKNFGS